LKSTSEYISVSITDSQEDLKYRSHFQASKWRPLTYISLGGRRIRAVDQERKVAGLTLDQVTSETMNLKIVTSRACLIFDISETERCTRWLEVVNMSRYDASRWDSHAY